MGVKVRQKVGVKVRQKVGVSLGGIGFPVGWDARTAEVCFAYFYRDNWSIYFKF